MFRLTFPEHVNKCYVEILSSYSIIMQFYNNLYTIFCFKKADFKCSKSLTINPRWWFTHQRCQMSGKMFPYCWGQSESKWQRGETQCTPLVKYNFTWTRKGVRSHPEFLLEGPLYMKIRGLRSTKKYCKRTSVALCYLNSLWLRLLTKKIFRKENSFVRLKSRFFFTCRL